MNEQAEKQEIYQQLEAAAVSYAALRDVPVCPVDESLVALSSATNLRPNQIGSDMLPYTGNEIFIRETVADMLSRASISLAEKPGFMLEVVYGYRALSVQQKLFERFYKTLCKQYTQDDLLEAVHRRIAVPEVAGHPTGGAVDVQIVRDGRPCEFGTKIWEFVPDAFTFSPFISSEAVRNREWLRSVMLDVGFAPYDGEWWHFSYGDREWARYYGKPAAIYEQIEFQAQDIPNV